MNRANQNYSKLEPRREISIFNADSAENSSNPYAADLPSKLDGRRRRLGEFIRILDSCRTPMALRLSNAFGGLENELRRHERRQKPDGENMAMELMESPTNFMLPGIQV